MKVLKYLGLLFVPFHTKGGQKVKNVCKPHQGPTCIPFLDLVRARFHFSNFIPFVCFKNGSFNWKSYKLHYESLFWNHKWLNSCKFVCKLETIKSTMYFENFQIFTSSTFLKKGKGIFKKMYIIYSFGLLSIEIHFWSHKELLNKPLWFHITVVWKKYNTKHLRFSMHHFLNHKFVIKNCLTLGLLSVHTFVGLSYATTCPNNIIVTINSLLQKQYCKIYWIARCIAYLFVNHMETLSLNLKF